jgi:hypothetical protein
VNVKQQQAIPAIGGVVFNRLVPGRGKPFVDEPVVYGVTTLNLTSSTSLANGYVFSANGCFDPNITGGALQPRGWKGLMVDYNHYTVTSAVITVSFANNSANPTYVGIVTRDDVSIDTDSANLRESPFAVFAGLTPANVAGSMATLQMPIKMRDWADGKSVLNNPVFRGDVLSNPSEGVYFHCVCWAVKGGSADIFMDVKIEYFARFTEIRLAIPGLLDFAIKRIQEHEREKKDPFQLVAQ